MQLCGSAGCQVSNLRLPKTGSRAPLLSSTDGQERMQIAHEKPRRFFDAVVVFELQIGGGYRLRWRILARMRRFFRPTLRRPFPVFFVPT